MSVNYGFSGLAWAFEQRSPTAVASHPKSKEYFQGERSDIAVSAAVRETFQNALDAKDEGQEGPVTVKFRREVYSASFFWNNVMGGIFAHMAAVKRLGLPSFDTTKDVEVLIIEDYSTTGLLGEINPNTWEQAEHTNFGNYWWRQGGSSKSKEAGGRHGIGKSTITELSEARVVIGISQRIDSPELVGYGQATFAPHRLDGADSLYDSYGMFGEIIDGRPYPFSGEAATKVAEDLRFDRAGKSGLSLMIPFPKLEVTDEALLEAVIKQCFYQICAGLLRVEIGSQVIDKNNIAELASSISETAELSPVIALAASSIEPKKQFRAARIDSGKTSLTESLFTEEEVEEMRQLWEDGETVDIAFEVPIKPKGKDVEWGEGRVLMRKHEDRDTMYEVFTRGRVTVRCEKSRSGGYLALFTASKFDILSAYLGDSENVAHTDWAKSRVKDRYDNHGEPMDRVKNAFKDAFTLITGIEQGRTIKNALTKFFWTTRVEEKPKNEPKDTPRPQQPMPDLPPKQPSPFELTQTSNGFTLRRTEREGNWGAHVEVYYSRSGNKKPSYHKADFDIAKLKLKTEGYVQFENQPALNVIDISEAQTDAVVSVSGFDLNREITIKIKAINKD